MRDKAQIDGSEYRLMLAIIAGITIAPAGMTFADPPSGSNYRLVFADEFNGTSLDTSKWSAASPSWTMPTSASTASAADVSVGNGELTLSANRPTSAGSFDSGSVSTYGKYTFTGGYAEARILLPTTAGSWPAFWGLYTGWPPETDVMEYPLTTDGGSSGLQNNQYNTNYHYTNSTGGASAGAGVVTTGSNLSTGWHIFGVDWKTGTSMTFYLDGNAVQSYTGSSVSQMQYMYMILDYAVGGWPGTPSTSQWPVGHSDQTQVDWVRVWQSNPNNDATSNWNINGGGSFGTSGNWTKGTPIYGNETAYFGRVGTASTASISMSAWQLCGGITFDGLTSGTLAGTTAYTLGSSANEIQLASTTGSVTVQATSVSAANQTINSGIELWSNTDVQNNMTGGQTLNLNGNLTGAGTLNVDGVGTVIVSGTNGYAGTTTIGSNQGPAVLLAESNSALSTGTVVIGAGGNGSTAVLQLGGGITVSNSIDFRGRNNSSVGIESISGNNTLSGTISANVGGSTYQIQSDSGILTLNGASAGGVALQSATGSRTFTLQGAGGGLISGVIQNGGGTVSLAKAGSGMWTLSGVNTLSGSVTVNGGILTLAGAGSVNSSSGLTVNGSGAKFVQTSSVPETPAITVTNGTLDGIGAVGAVTVVSNAANVVANGNGGMGVLTMASLNFSGNGIDNMRIIGASSMTTPGQVVTGMLTTPATAGAITLNVTAQGLITGTYDLIQYSTLSGIGASAFSVGTTVSLGNHQTATVGSNGSYITLVVGGSLDEFTAADSNVWHVGTTGSNHNFKLSSAGNGIDYANGDSMLFDDTAATGSVNLTLAVSPAWTIFSNSSLAYTLSSSGGYGIGGSGGVTKIGNGVVTLATSNTYTGTTQINAGTLSISADNNLGSTAAPVTLYGGTLQTTAGITNTHTFVVGSGGGTINVNSTGSSGTGQYYFNTTNALTGSGALTLTGNGSLTTTGAGNLRVDHTNSYSGNLTVQSGGIFEYGTAGAVAATATFTVANQGEVPVQGFGTTMPNSITVTGNTNSVLSFENANAGVFSGPVMVNSGANLTVGLRDWYNYANVRSGTISGVISGAGGLAVNSGSGAGGVLTLTGANTFTGNVTVNNATVAADFGQNNNSLTFGALGNPQSSGRTVTINNGGTITFVLGNVLGGGGASAPPALSFIVNAGGVLQTAAPGIGGDGGGDANIFGNITLNGGTFTTGNGYNASYQAAILLGTVTVGGTTPSTINTNATNTLANGVMLSTSGGTTFNVALTGGTGSDLIVSAPLVDSNSGSAGSLIKTGAGTMQLTAANTFTGNLNINSGFLIANRGNNVVNPTSSALGNPQVARNLSINSGGTLVFASGDTLGGATSAVLSTLVVNQGGVVTNTGGVFNTLGPVQLDGGTLTGIGGAIPAYQMYNLRGTVTVGGNSASMISGSGTNDGYHLAAPTTFNVADATNDANTDLTVSAPLIDQDGTHGGSGSLTKTGLGTMLLSAANTYTGNTVLNTGTLTLGSSASLASQSITVSTSTTFNANGVLNSSPAVTDDGNLIFGANPNAGLLTRTVGSLTIHNGGVTTVAAPVAGNNANRTLMVSGGLSFDGSSGAWQGKLDLTANDMVVHGGNLSNITNQLAQGYNGPTLWTGTTGIASTTAANDATGLSTLGVAQGLTTFDGGAVLASDVLVKYTYYGDANLDGHVDGTDYTLIDSGYGGAGTGWQYGDFNYDGVIDGSDYSLIDNTFNQQTSAGYAVQIATQTSEITTVSTADFGELSRAVPEPANIGWVACGIV
jgi:autotransporter-associated beta strand protein